MGSFLKKSIRGGCGTGVGIFDVRCECEAVLTNGPIVQKIVDDENDVSDVEDSDNRDCRDILSHD
jgi:hypothetical protein